MTETEKIEKEIAEDKDSEEEPEPESKTEASESEKKDASPARRKRRKIKVYSADRRGFMRSTTEEGIGEELMKLRVEAQGTPFFDAKQPQKKAQETEEERRVRQEVNRRLEDLKKRLAK